MSGNTRTLKVVGGDLFLIAADVMGDAEQWYIIAAANNLTDNVLPPTPMTLVIPPALPAGTSNGGILGAPT
jgi:hypothetical protein